MPPSLDPTAQALRVQTRGAEMALVDRVQTEVRKRNRQGLSCSVGDLIDGLPPGESAALETMLASGWSQNQIYDAVTAEGHYIGRQTINRHRSKACRCFQ